MTSKHLFFKAMGEDLRHKMWMIALSCLCCFLCFPVAWLMGWSDSGSIGTTSRWTLQFFRDYLSGAGGFIAIAGALIVGLSGFRFVFHKNMIDTYHSMPIKRRTLFGVTYLNGFLIWFVPFVLSLLLTLLMAGSVILRLFGSHVLTTVLGNIGRCCLMLILLFLLVYHLVLVAVMLSGNILNTLVSLVIMGVGVISIYGLYIAYCQLYLSTFYEQSNIDSWFVYMSPLASVFFLLMEWKDNYLSLAGMESFVLGNAIVMMLLGFAAFWLYEKRASEHAEQGIKNKPVSFLMRLAVSVAAGQGGWLIFATITGYGGYNALGWGIFGSILFGVLSFGIMNMVFYMDFKTFFAHKLQMISSVALVLLFSFAIYGDWMDFDHYLPKREEVAELAISTNHYKSYTFDSDILSTMHIQDMDAIYAFLERMANRGIGRWGVNMTDREYDDYRKSGENIWIRVTLQNGKSYYRNYYMLEEDWNVMWPLFINEAYLEASYLIPKEGLIGCDYVFIDRDINVHTQMPLENVKELIDAYNQDVLEDPEAILTGNGKLLVSISLGMDYYWQDIQAPIRRYYTLDIYDTMEHSKEALNRMNYGELTADFRAEDIDEIVLRYANVSRDSTASGRPVNSEEEAMDVIRDYFGLESLRSASVVEESGGVVQQTVNTVTILNEDGSYSEYSGYMGLLEVPITEQAEIEELVPLLSYAAARTSSGVFQTGSLQVKVTDKEGNTYNCYLRMGTLPEKYIEKFEPLVEELFED